MDSITEADMRAIVRLLGEAAMVQGDFLEKKRHVLDGVCDLAGATEWCWLILDRPPTEPGARVCSGISRTLGLAAPPLPLPADSPHLQLVVAGSRSKDRILSHRPVGAEDHSVIVLTKPASQRPYSEREKVLSLLILEGIPWLHWQEPPAAPSGKTLPLRLRRLQDLLLLGLGRKEIAHRLGVTLGTINGYSRELYEFHGVTSHSALMRSRTRGSKLA